MAVWRPTFMVTLGRVGDHAYPEAGGEGGRYAGAVEAEGWAFPLKVPRSCEPGWQGLPPSVVSCFPTSASNS